MRIRQNAFRFGFKTCFCRPAPSYPAIAAEANRQDTVSLLHPDAPRANELGVA
jgi:hypothetical protein